MNGIETVTKRRTMEALLSDLDASSGDEVQAGRIAGDLLSLGPDGLDALIEVLLRSSGKSPKLSVAVLNVLRKADSPLVRDRISGLLDEGNLAEDDRTFLLAIMNESDSADASLRNKLLRELARTTDPVNRSEILGQIVRHRIHEARDRLTNLAREIDGPSVDYNRDPEQAARKEMVLFALMALEGRYEGLEKIIFDQGDHPARRSAALEFLSLALGAQAGRTLRRAAADQNRDIRGVAAGLIGELGLAELMDVVEETLDDPDPWVV
jgi:hypothetical protein